MVPRVDVGNGAEEAEVIQRQKMSMGIFGVEGQVFQIMEDHGGKKEKTEIIFDEITKKGT